MVTFLVKDVEAVVRSLAEVKSCPSFSSFTERDWKSREPVFSALQVNVTTVPASTEVADAVKVAFRFADAREIVMAVSFSVC